MAEQPFSGQFTSLLLEGLAHYRKGEMAAAMKSWEAAYHTEAGNPQAREFLRTALLRLHAELDKESGRSHPWLTDPLPPPGKSAPPEPTSPWDEGPSRAISEASMAAPRLPTPLTNAKLNKPTPAKGVPALRATPTPLPRRMSAPPPPPPEALIAATESRGATLDFARPPPPPRAALEEEPPLPLPAPPWSTPPAPPPEEEKLGHEWRDTERELEKLEARRTAGQTTAVLREARDRLARKDFGGALELTAQVLAHEPNHPEAHLVEAECEAGVTEVYEAALGGLQRSPRLLIPPEQLTRLHLDTTAGFVLSQIDGQVTYEELFAISHLTRLETARILARLVREGVIGS